MSMVRFLATAVASPGVSTGPSVVCNDTPFVPGRNAVMKNSAITAGTVVVETASRADPNFTAPTTIATITPTSPTTQEVTPLDYYVRYRVTGAVTGNLTIHLEGVQ